MGNRRTKKSAIGDVQEPPTPPEEAAPHKFLVDIAAGKPVLIKENRIVRFKKGAKIGKIMRIDQEEYEYYPSFKERFAAAVAAAPYVSPKLAVKFVGENVGSDSIEKLLRELAENLPS